MLEILQDRIEQGLYTVGERLPSERKLALEYKVPQSQIHRKLQELTQLGYLECLRGNGYFVRAGLPQATRLYRVAFCNETMRSANLGQDFYTELLFNLSPLYSITLSVFAISPERDSQNRLFMQLINDGYEGIITFPHHITGMFPALLELKRQGIPLIFWDFSPLPGVFPAVGVDHYGSCFNAARILAERHLPVTYIGFREQQQNRMKLAGFEDGCRTYGVEIEKRILLSYSEFLASGQIDWRGAVEPGKLYFTSTRLLSLILAGKMADHGCQPGRDYEMLATDRLQFMEGSSLQLDCMMRNNARVIRKLLFEMRRAIRRNNFLCNDYRIPMDYVAGSSLRH